MAKIRKIGMAAGTFCAALGIGFVMQNGDALASRFSADNSAPAVPAPFMAPENGQNGVTSAAFETSGTATTSPSIADGMIDADASDVATEIATIPAILPAPTLPLQTPPEQFAVLEVDAQRNTQIDASVVTEVDCIPVMTSAASAGAMVDISITARCYADASFTMHHQGMMFTARTDSMGSATLAVPALAEVAVFIAAFQNGEGAVTTSAVPDFVNYDRAVLQWEGDAGVMLSAYEAGAGFGEQGHITGANPGSLERLQSAEGGYLVRLGDPRTADAMMAEIYSFPAAMTGQYADVFLVAEAEITAANCGKDINAQSLQVVPTGTISASDLIMTMPDCNAVGDFLILQNMFDNLIVASR